ncbi:hypothetical protein [Deinococcus sp. AB2017081]|nr:hypothetical protein [Deinococcus sp. AB2017081]WQE95036.1 hypothetical protein U2P90_16850 [Deinococcus sp. AB2017081]
MKTGIPISLVVFTTAFLSACGGDTTSPPDPKPIPVQISGTQITGKVGGEALIPGTVLLATTSDLSVTNKGTLNAAGALSLDLKATPEAETLSTLLPTGASGCTYAGTGDHTLQISAWSRLAVVSSKGDFLGTVQERRNDQTFSVPHHILRIYSSGTSTFKGTVSCSGSPQLSLNVSLRAGWNAVEYVDSEPIAALQDLPAAATAELIGTAQAPQVSAYLDANGGQLNFTTDTLSVRATFFQDGGFSGTVHLSTDNDLLTVGPSTLTLPALSAQKVSRASQGIQAMGLGQQRVDATLTFKLIGNASGTVNLLVKDDQGRELDRVPLYVISSLPAFSMYLYTSPVTVLPGASLPLSINVSGMNGFSGKVDITAQNPPTGLSVTPASVSVSQGSANGQVTLNAAASLAPGTYTVTLLGTSGSVRSTTPIAVTVPAPTVALTTDSATVYGGEQTTLPITVTGLNNFAGSVTLAVSGLPAGVTSSSKSVTLTKNGVVSTTLTLTGGTALLSGTSEVTLTATGQAITATRPFTLATRPKRTLLGKYRVVGVGTALDGGFWYVRQVEGSAIYPVLTRFDGTKATDAATLKNNNGYIYVDVLPIPGGGVWLPGLGGGPLFKYSSSALRYWDAAFGWDSPPAVDAQGRLWAVVFKDNMHKVARFDETSSTFDAVTDLSWSSFSKLLGSSRDGSVMAAYDSDQSEVVTVNTSTLAVKRTSATGFSSISKITVDDSGTPWIYGVLPSSERAVGKVGSDGTVAITKLPASFDHGTQVFAFDASGVLWIAGGGFAGTLTPSTGAVRSLTVAQDASPSYALNPSGGLWQVWTDGTGNTYTSLYK